MSYAEDIAEYSIGWASIQLDCAVLLVLGLEIDYFSPSNLGLRNYTHDLFKDRNKYEDLRKKFNLLRKRALNQIDSNPDIFNGKKASEAAEGEKSQEYRDMFNNSDAVNLSKTLYKHVSLKKFGAWAQSIDYKLPEGFPCVDDEPINTQPTIERDKQINANDFKFSGLLNVPERVDEWFEVIDCMVKEYYEEYSRIPTENQAWSRLSSKSPEGYEISTDTDKVEAFLKMPGFKPLGKSAFKKRWLGYSPITPNKAK